MMDNNKTSEEYVEYYENRSAYGKNRTIIQKTVKSGISFGTALAIVISYTNWHSVGWAIFHGILGWMYVIYYVIVY